MSTMALRLATACLPRTTRCRDPFGRPHAVNRRHPATGDCRHPLLAAAAKLATEHRLRAGSQQLVCDPYTDDHALAGRRRRPIDPTAAGQAA